MGRKVILWTGSYYTLDKGETAKEALNEFTEGGIIFEGEPDVMKVTTRGGKTLAKY